MTDLLAAPLVLPCGFSLKNRLAKAAMTEGLADPHNRATEKHVRLYSRWATGGAGLLVTGNVQIDRAHLERPGNVAIDGVQSVEALTALRAFATAGTAHGAALFMQISHAGRQTPKHVNARPLAPSAIPLKLPGGQFGKPRAMTESQIEEAIRRFAFAARMAQETGFSGVQIHAAHGYLLSEFLSPRANVRKDRWGGSLENRARFLREVLSAVRREAGPAFPVSVKLNSADFQKGGFSSDEALDVVRMLNDLGADLLEVSGGTYEQPKMAGLEGVLEPVVDPNLRESTRRREAYFLAYAEAIARVARMPLMVTGGFRTRAGMEEALASGACQMIGLGRPLCVETDVPARLLDRRIERAPEWEKRLRLGRGWLSENSPLNAIKMVNGWGAQGWYCLQLLRMGDGENPDVSMGVWRAFNAYRRHEVAAAKALAKLERAKR